MRLRVIETDPSADPRWDGFVKSHPRGLIYHHSLWLAALQNEFGQNALSLACVDENNEFKGIFPLLYTRGLPFRLRRIGRHFTGRRLASLPRTPVAGPLSNSPGAERVLLLEAARRAKESPGTTVQIKTDTNCLADVPDGIKGALWRNSYVLNLPGETGSKVRFGNAKEHHKVAWAVNRGLRLGVKVREAKNEEDLAEWYRLYLATMRRVVALPRPYHFFEELWRKMRPQEMMKLLLAEKAGAGGVQMLAGSVFLSYGSTVHYAFTGCNALAFATHANDLLQWEAIHAASKEGFRYYDFGEVVEHRPELARFKLKWCATTVPLYRYHFPTADSLETRAAVEPLNFAWVREIWQCLPLVMTRSFGSRIFGRL
ncbi:MAG: GNAT family N-acetyltransferase [Terriglobia bacterium]